MLTNAPVAPTLPVADLARARRFYERKLGLKPSSAIKGDETGMWYDCGMGTKLMLYQRAPTKADNTAAEFMVEDVEREVRELKAKGVKFEDYDIPSMGIKTVNGIATMGKWKGAWFKDTEGNILSISQMVG